MQFWKMSCKQASTSGKKQVGHVDEASKLVIDEIISGNCDAIINVCVNSSNEINWITGL